MPKYPNLPWTSEDDEFLRENYGKLTNSDISERMKRNYMGIRQRALKLGLEARKPYKRKNAPNQPAAATTFEHSFEIAAIGTCANALQPLNKEQRQRALRYLAALYELDWLQGLEA